MFMLILEFYIESCTVVVVSKYIFEIKNKYFQSFVFFPVIYDFYDNSIFHMQREMKQQQKVMVYYYYYYFSRDLPMCILCIICKKFYVLQKIFPPRVLLFFNPRFLSSL